MKISGPVITRFSKQFADFIGKTGTVYSVSFVHYPPMNYVSQNYGVAIVDLDDGSRHVFQVDSSTRLLIGDKIKIVLRFAYTTDEGLKFYIPKIVRYE